MSRTAFVNGAYVQHADASVHVEDRGYLFADGVYEVCGVAEGLLLDEIGHIDRLERSLRELRMALPLSRQALRLVMREVVRRNRLRDGIVYVQITRGAAPRDHGFPPPGTPLSVVVMAHRQDTEKMEARAAKGVTVVTMPDLRWGRCDIKSVSLLPNVLAKQSARDAGAYEAWLVDADGHITEGSSTNAWIVDKAGQLVTRPVDQHILCGITRAAIMSLAARQGLKVVERSFTVDEAKGAREAFITAATAYVTPVIEIDDAVIGNGVPGSIATALRADYRRAALAAAERPRALPI